MQILLVEILMSANHQLLITGREVALKKGISTGNSGGKHPWPSSLSLPLIDFAGCWTRPSLSAGKRKQQSTGQFSWGRHRHGTARFAQVSNKVPGICLPSRLQNPWIDAPENAEREVAFQRFYFLLGIASLLAHISHTNPTPPSPLSLLSSLLYKKPLPTPSSSSTHLHPKTTRN
jgi:hypothetical protein